MKLHEYQIEDARAMMYEYAELEGLCYDENSRALIKRFVEMVEGWVLDDLRRQVDVRFNSSEPFIRAGMRINPYGDRP